MFDINTIINTAITAAVTEAVKPLLERIEALEANIAGLQNSIDQKDTRIAALENPAPANPYALPATITADAFVTHLDNQEWFWEKLDRRIEAATEDKMGLHLECYDHDNYDDLDRRVDDMPDFDDLVTRDELRSEIEDVLNNCTLSLSL